MLGKRGEKNISEIILEHYTKIITMYSEYYDIDVKCMTTIIQRREKGKIKLYLNWYNII